jgi:hypothetical protein
MPGSMTEKSEIPRIIFKVSRNFGGSLLKKFQKDSYLLKV